MASEFQPLRLQLETPAYGGTHIARDDARLWFVGYGVSGETIIAQPRELRAGVGFADVIEVVTPSPLRVEPPCKHFGVGRCGGCQLQHLRGDAQRAAKERIMREQLHHIGGFSDVSVRPIRALDHEWAYRAHVTFHITDSGEPGFVSTDGHTVLPVETCHIVHPDMLELLPALRSLHLPAGSRVRVHRADADVTQLNASAQLAAVLVDPRGRLIRPLFGAARLYHQVRQYRYGVQPHGFFQVNARGAAILVDEVLGAISTDTADAHDGYEHALDLFCGVGLFSLPLSDIARRVTGIEIAPEALEDARVNARAARRENITFHAGAVEKLAGAVPSADLVVLDPPRAGVKPAVIEVLQRLAPRTIVYVSCDPTTLARDLRVLVAHGYRIDYVQPIDLFPQTYHIETVTRLTRTHA